MQCTDMTKIFLPLRKGIVQIVDMKMHDVELGRAGENSLEHYKVMRERVRHALVEA